MNLLNNSLIINTGGFVVAEQRHFPGQLELKGNLRIHVLMVQVKVVTGNPNIRKSMDFRGNFDLGVRVGIFEFGNTRSHH